VLWDDRPVSESRPFLRAQWRHLAMVNYEVDPALLEPLVPAGTVLDRFQDRCYVSLVGFLFLDVRLRGMRVPFHGRFEEVNLRFYVRRSVAGETRRAVTFVRELVPLPAVALLARLVYGERYSSVPMRHRVTDAAVAYRWRYAGRWQGLEVAPEPDAALPEPGSEQEFVTEHYWGYAATRRGTVEYEVVHPRWTVQRAAASVDCDAEALYGPGFAAALAANPTSAFLADGSPVAVMPGQVVAR
jgi:uncharacterized protein YqjF (DUF2071 family)